MRAQVDFLQLQALSAPGAKHYDWPSVTSPAGSQPWNWTPCWRHFQSVGAAKGPWLNTREMVTKPASTPPNALGAHVTLSSSVNCLFLTTSEPSQVPPMGGFKRALSGWQAGGGGRGDASTTTTAATSLEADNKMAQAFPFVGRKT